MQTQNKQNKTTYIVVMYVIKHMQHWKQNKKKTIAQVRIETEFLWNKSNKKKPTLNFNRKYPYTVFDNFSNPY